MIHYKRLQTAEEVSALRHLYIEVFELAEAEELSSEYAATLVANPAIIFLAAFDGEQMVGGLTAYILPSIYAEKPEMYLYDLAILASYQRKGLGRQLLEELKIEARKHNVSEFYVQADIVDDGALAFYRGTGGIEEDVRHFGYPV